MKEKRILLVDDQRAATHLWKTLLEQTGKYCVEEENRASHAVRTAQDFCPDLIVLDVQMPGLDGGDVAADLKRDKHLRRVPIIFMTSMVTPAEAASGKRVEGHPALAKPVRIQDLDGAIEKYLLNFTSRLPLLV